MRRSLRSRLLILGAILLWVGWWITPTLRASRVDPDVREANERAWREQEELDPTIGGFALVQRKLDQWWRGRHAITLGLDLRGGMHLMMQVDTDAAVANELARIRSLVEAEAREQELTLSLVTVAASRTVNIEYDPAQDDAVRELLSDTLGRNVDIGGVAGALTAQLPADTARREADLAVRQALETIRNRIDEFGVAEPVLQREGDDRLLIQLPGVRDPKRVLALIGRTAQLEFSHVKDQAQTEAELLRRVNYRLPANEIIRPGTITDSFGVDQEVFYRLAKSPIITGADLKDARVGTGQFGDYVVNFQLDRDGGVRFGRWTKDNIGELLSITLDGHVQSAPRIEGRIADRGQISGSYTVEEAEDLSIMLRAGALPAPVKVIEQRTVGPTLGQDSIRSGVRAGLVGFLCVLVFMVLYYRISGVIAVLAVFLNILIVLAALAAFGATLTLPGIAGLILTVGMAVDANVLIFERIREEVGKGKTLRSAVDAAFERVTLTIMDANLTTLITAIVLFQFGTGPVKGFAVTLSIGIVASLYTALIGTRMAYDWLLGYRSVRALTMMRLVGATHVPFLDVRRIALGVSVVLLAVGGLQFYQRGAANFGVDFTQGTLVQAALTPPQDSAAVRRALTGAGIERATVQSLGDAGGVLVRTGFVDADGVAALTGAQVEQALIAAFGEAGVDILRTEEVGAAVSQDLTRDAFLALLYSVGAIIVYISFRFEFRFAIGAVAALVHDVGITMGMFALTGHEITLPVVAALLTVVGYSLNDTIVVFDRVRENQRAMRGRSLIEILNASVNETLGRTILTSLTTLLVVAVLYLWGGAMIHDFAFALLIGVVVGTYSSIFIASLVVLEWQILRPQRWRGSALPTRSPGAAS